MCHGTRGLGYVGYGLRFRAPGLTFRAYWICIEGFQTQGKG